MQLLQKSLNKLNGLYYKQDYLCLDKQSFQRSLKSYIISGNRIIRNVTDQHLFTGYCPLVFAFPSFPEIDLSGSGKVVLAFTNHEFQSNDSIAPKDIIAGIYLNKIRQQVAGTDLIFYYEGHKGEHGFISSFHQSVIQLQNRLYNKKPGNVYLAGNLLKQVQIAYSLPRVISLITVGSNGIYNLFPTDLHGQIDNQHYIISLRYGGKAAQQVETTKRIIITEINPSMFKTAYDLGKNHMQEYKSKDQFPLTSDLSESYGLPVPIGAAYCRELELQEYFDHGIHRIFLFRIINKTQIGTDRATLAHIHNVYATWRHNNGLPGNYLLR